MRSYLSLFDSFSLGAINLGSPRSTLWEGFEPVLHFVEIILNYTSTTLLIDHTIAQMSWFSILPPQLATLETWLVRLFLLLALLTIGPWLVLIVYDFLLYLVRTLLFEVPYFGGRAQGASRPRLPSLSERPDGRPRKVSIVRAGNNGSPPRASERSPKRRRYNGPETDEFGEEEETGRVEVVSARDTNRQSERRNGNRHGRDSSDYGG